MHFKNIKFVLFIFFVSFINSESILIKNATILDGKDNEPFIGNVLIEGNRISKVSSKRPPIPKTLMEASKKYINKIKQKLW